MIQTPPAPITGQYPGHVITLDQSEAMIQTPPAPSIWRLIITAWLSRYHYDRPGISADYCD